MSASAALQAAIYQALVADVGVHALIADRIYDGAPELAAYPHVEFGTGSFVPEISLCVTSRIVSLQLDIWARDQGRKYVCIQVIDAVHKALHLRDDIAIAAPFRILWIEARGQEMEDPDGKTWHGIVTVEAEVQEYGAGA